MAGTTPNAFQAYGPTGTTGIGPVHTLVYAKAYGLYSAAPPADTSDIYTEEYDTSARKNQADALTAAVAALSTRINTL